MGEVFGVPAHPLMVHGAVVFGPLLAVGAVAYVVLVRLRPLLGWAVGLLAVAAPLAAFTAVMSGDALLGTFGTGPARDRMMTHRGYGLNALWLSLALGVLALVLLALHRAAAKARGLVAEAPGEARVSTGNALGGAAGPADVVAGGLPAGGATEAAAGGPPGWLTTATSIMLTVVAGVALFYFVRAGHTGAQAHWGGLG